MTLGWRLRILAAGLVLPPLLRIFSVERVAGSARAWGKKRPSAEQQREIAQSVDRLLERLPPPWRRTCLTRSIVLFHLLRGSGVPVVLCLGVRKANEQVAAHSWLSRDGSPYLEPEDATSFELIARFPDQPLHEPA